MKTLARALVGLGLTLICWGQPSESGLDLSNLDPSTPASQDFFQYANGGWLKANPIPADKPRWGTFNQLFEQNQEKLHDILKAAGHDSDPESRQLDAFFRSGTDPAALAAGLPYLRAQLAEVSAISDLEALRACVAQLHSQGVRPYFTFGSAQDYRDSQQVIGQLQQGGLGLPDRDYYLRDDEKSKGIVQGYRSLIAGSFEKLGDSPQQAEEKSRRVVELETSMARASMTLVQQRDPEATYHPVAHKDLPQRAPGWNWDAYFSKLGARLSGHVNLAMPDYFLALAQLLEQQPLPDHQAYLQWTLIRTSADYLDEAWSALHFELYGQKLTGAQSMPPRWRRVVKVIDQQMGDALGKRYVAQHFPPAAKAKVDDMVQRLRAALGTTLEQLDWMSPATKKAARVKLDSFRAKIGYPERWRDYSSLTLDPGCYLKNVRQCQAFEVKRDLAKIGKPQDKGEWYMSPPTVNAYYDPQNNEIVFPAGIMQPPFFDLNADDAVNYGGIGMVIGHEITHGFDDQGAQFDERGNLRNWWTAEDLKKFQELSKAIEDQFSSYKVADDLNINGKLVVGESIADLGGLKLALMAYRDSLAGQSPRTLDGFSPEQRFFLGYARIWAMNLRPEYERLQVNTDPHPHPRFRVNGPLSNLEEFQRAFQCPPDSAMVRKQRNRVW